MALEISNSLWAMCAVDAKVGPTYFFNRGFAATITRNGAGDYSLTLDQGLDSTQCSVHITPRQSPGAIVACVHTSDEIKQILLFDAAGMAADIDFDVVVLAIPSQ